ncbi:nucleotidyl transferase AbiEii/AbiGii toxin family protein [Pararhodobacter oceanensis]|uniref:Nucleotidyl transferase AbiEii/AbiGii toxin family protein n=1 Tax=Pararhodobacter oceanensis TaxID=2172121 RepID=A0A2T8HUJ0_9RHOB|nr:nucleotidyl transferase AbiEii/AbiGii toxin family protein [Pararhodobacter oceanensis]PVH29012.1 hypothetical protein DDE20_08235 [Pararhodobacter oceanensis]
MNTPSPSRWPELFDAAVSIIAQANAASEVVRYWAFGGGTALMLQIDHRESHDVDFFIDDPSVLPYLNPETQDFQLRIAPSTYKTDGVQSLKIVFDGIGEIDFICSFPVLTEATVRFNVRGALVELETPAEIIAKKIYHRGNRLQPRDMFDIAATARHFGDNYLVQALSKLPEQTAEALNVAKEFDAGLLGQILEGLNVRAGYEDVRQTAQADTIRICSHVIGASRILRRK